MQRELKKQRVAVFSEQMLQGDHGKVFEPLYQDSQTDGTMYTDNHKAFYINILMKRTHTNSKIQECTARSVQYEYKNTPDVLEKQNDCYRQRNATNDFCFLNILLHKNPSISILLSIADYCLLYHSQEIVATD